MRTLLTALAVSLLPGTAWASLCYAFVEDLRRDLPGVRYAQLGPPDLTAGEVRITYVAHSTFRIETEAGIVVATDFFGSAGRTQDGPILPDVVTMNHAHETHYTDFPDPKIKHVLRGWNHDGSGPADYKLRLDDITIRNVTTDIRGWGAPEKDGNSIFIFEVADLCIGHLGHLHHVLTEPHYAKVGRLDIVMAPVDGTFTLDLPSMIEVLKTLKARVVLPMHAFGTASLERFLAGMQDEFSVRVNDGPSAVFSLTSLPREATVLMMPASGSAPVWRDD